MRVRRRLRPRGRIRDFQLRSRRLHPRRQAGRAGGGGFGGGFEDILRDAFGGWRGGRRGGPARTFEPEDFGVGADVTAALTVSLLKRRMAARSGCGLPSGKEVEVKIPAGLLDGQQIRLKGQGMAGPGGPGDLLITVTIAPHPIFKLDGTRHAARRAGHAV